MKRTPDYRVGYTLDDNLQVITEVRAYVTQGEELRNQDPLGKLEPFILNKSGSIWHSKNYFFKDDNSLVRTLQRAS